MKKIARMLAMAAMILAGYSASAQAEVFTPVSVTPDSGLLTNGETIELKFDFYVDWYMRISEYSNSIAFEPLNGSATDPVMVSTYQGATVNYKSLKVKFEVPATGYEDVTDWALVVPANQIVNTMTNVANDEIRIEYSAGSTPPPAPSEMKPVSITPDPMLPVEAPFTRIELTYPESAGDVDINPFFFTLKDKNGKEYLPQVYTLGNVVVFDSFEISDAGTYTLTLDEGFATSESLGSNDAASYTWTVEAETPPVPEELVAEMVTPDTTEAVAPPFNRIDIYYPEAAGDLDINPFFFTLRSDEGKMFYPQIFTNGNQVIFDSFEITENGIYTLTLDEGFASSPTMGESNAESFTWTVSAEDSINTIGTDNSEAIYYDLDGKRVNNPERGRIVIRVGNRPTKVVK